MELLLWRHAEAVEAGYGEADMQRHLTSRGEKQAQLVASWLEQQKISPIRILVSPAIRCQQTAQSLALPYETDERLGPGADVTDLLVAAGGPADQSPHDASVLLVSHQPTLGRLAALLLSGQEANWTIRKGALWWFSFRKRENTAPVLLKAVIDANLI